MDRYEPSNINRQLFAASKTLRRYKVDVAPERIREINPFAEIEMAIRTRVDNESVHPFVKGAGILLQNADHPSCTFNFKLRIRNSNSVVNLTTSKGF